MSEAINADRLISLVERIERLMEEKKGLEGDIKDILSEAKADGYEPKWIKKCIALKGQDSEKRKMDEAEFEMYKAALGID